MASLVRRVLVLLVVVVLAAVAVVVLFSGETSNPPLVPGTGADNDPLTYTPGREDAFAAAAARGHAHVIYAKSPGGARASAERVARYRPLVEAAAEAGDIEPDTLEALVLLESAGRPDATADPQLEGAVGLTQILAETGRNLLKMQVDPAGARRIGRSLRRAAGTGDSALIARLRERRRMIDERFDPPKALAATVRYLVLAREELGRADLAVVGLPHGHRQPAERAARLRRGRHLLRAAVLRLHADAPRGGLRRLAALGDDSATYLWRVNAAREIMRLYRSDPAQLDRVSRLQTAKNSAEEVLHPADETERSRRRRSCAPPMTPAGSSRCRAPAARARRRDRPRDGRARRAAEALAHDLPRAAQARPGRAGLHRRRGQVDLRRRAARRHEHGARQGLPAPAAAPQPRGDAELLLAHDRLVVRRHAHYASRAQALAFEFMLERLQSHNLIAWVREPAAIHVTVSRDADRLAAVLDP